MTKEHSPRLCPKCSANWISGEEECDCELGTLLERLRSQYCEPDDWDGLCREAADEIERLQSVRDHWQEQFNNCADEIERLKQMSALAKFGALVFDEHRAELGNLDGGWLEETALKCRLLESVTVVQSCGEYCRCADYDEFPQMCLQKTQFARALDVSDDE